MRRRLEQGGNEDRKEGGGGNWGYRNTPATTTMHLILLLACTSDISCFLRSHYAISLAQVLPVHSMENSLPESDRPPREPTGGFTTGPGTSGAKEEEDKKEGEKREETEEGVVGKEEGHKGPATRVFLKMPANILEKEVVGHALAPSPGQVALRTQSLEGLEQECLGRPLLPGLVPFQNLRGRMGRKGRGHRRGSLVSRIYFKKKKSWQGPLLPSPPYLLHSSHSSLTLATSTLALSLFWASFSFLSILHSCFFPFPFSLPPSFPPSPPLTSKQASMEVSKRCS